MSKGEKQFFTSIVGYLVIIIVAATCVVIGYPSIGKLVGFGGTVLWLFLQMLYVVFLDSRSRWPGTSAFQRFANLITFKR